VLFRSLIVAGSPLKETLPGWNRCEFGQPLLWLMLLLYCSLLAPAARAEHQTVLRGIVNAPGFQVALLQIQHTLPSTRSNAPPTVIATSRRVRAGETFQDATIKGANFQFEVLELDLAKETVKTREDGQAHVYTLPVPERPAGATGWLHLKDAAFNDVIDLYSEIEKRVVLVHPSVERGTVSLASAWTGQSASRSEASAALANYLGGLGISPVPDGSKFLRLVPTKMSLQTNVGFKDLPTASTNVVTLMLVNSDPVRMYASISGRRLTGNPYGAGQVAYLNVNQALSTAELLYALETLMGWNGTRVVLGDDNTFSLVPAGRARAGGG